MNRLLTGLAGLGTLFAGAAVSVAAESEAVMLLYQKQEPGIQPYSSRIIVTDRFVRFDDGAGEGNFALYDRERQMVFNVVHEDQTVMEIRRKPVDIDPPVPLQLSEETINLNGNAPEIAGRQPEQHALYAGVKRCYSVVAVPDLLSEVTTALTEFRKVMAGEHAFALEYIPADQQDACDMAIHIFRPGWFLQYGLPIQHWDEAGNMEALLDYEVGFEVAPALFELPEDYRHYSIRGN